MLFSEFAAHVGVLSVAQIDAVQTLIPPDPPQLTPRTQFVQTFSDALSAGSITPDPPTPPNKLSQGTVESYLLALSPSQLLGDTHPPVSLGVNLVEPDHSLPPPTRLLGNSSHITLAPALVDLLPPPFPTPPPKPS